MKAITTIGTICAFLAAFAAGEANAPLTFGKPKRNAKMEQALMKRTGGFVESADSFKGKIAVVDAREKQDPATFSPILASFTKVCKVNAEIVGGDARAAKAPKDALKKAGANVGVIVVDDDDTPQLLVAPDDGWAIVNARPLVKGVEKSRLAALRVQKETLRALGLVCGGMSSQFMQSLAGPVTKPSDLDGMEPLELPLDVSGACKQYLTAFGVTQYVSVPYFRACQEGWAPAPTNDVQKAIWDKVHAMPKAPLEIKPEAKKVKE